MLQLHTSTPPSHPSRHFFLLLLLFPAKTSGHGFNNHAYIFTQNHGRVCSWCRNGLKGFRHFVPGPQTMTLNFYLVAMATLERGHTTRRVYMQGGKCGGRVVFFFSHFLNACLFIYFVVVIFKGRMIVGSCGAFFVCLCPDETDWVGRKKIKFCRHFISIQFFFLDPPRSG